MMSDQSKGFMNEDGWSIEELRGAVLDWIDQNVPHKWLSAARSGDLRALRAVRTPIAYREWYPVFGRSGLVAADWPSEYGGLGLDGPRTGVVNAELGRAGLVKLNPIALALAGPTLMEWGTAAQKARYLPPIVTSEEIWCQLFSEPGAGSDLASLATRAEWDGNSWIVTGQKVWSSFAHEATFGLLLARTDPNVVKRRGISYFILDLRLPGVTVRPLKKITGESEFNEVFMDAVRVPDSMRVGAPGQGWEVARTTLNNERRMLAGEGASIRDRVSGRSVDRLLRLALQPLDDGALPADDPVLRDKLASLWLESQTIRWTNRRIRDARRSGRAAGPEASIMKVLQSEHNQRLQACAMMLVGLRGIAASVDDSESASIAYGYLRSRGDTIAGGTSEIQRNLVGERVLNLPREPSQFDSVPWRELPRGGST